MSQHNSSSDYLPELLKNPLTDQGYANSLTGSDGLFGQDSVQGAFDGFDSINGYGGSGSQLMNPATGQPIDVRDLGAGSQVTGFNLGGGDGGSGNFLSNIGSNIFGAFSDAGSSIGSFFNDIANWGTDGKGGVSSIWGEGGLAGGALGLANLGIGAGELAQQAKNNKLKEQAFNNKWDAYNQQVGLQTQGLNRDIETDYRKRASMYRSGNLPGYNSLAQYLDKNAYKPTAIG